MVASRTKYFTSVNFSETNLLEVRLITYLKNTRESSGDEVKAQVIRALTAFYSVYAIAEDPNSTQAEVEQAFTKSLNMLSGQMSDIAAYCRGRIPLSTDSWQRFGLLPSSFPPLAISTGSIAPLPQAIASPPPSPSPAVEIAQVPQSVPVAPPPEVEIDVENMSDEEYDAYLRSLPNDHIEIKKP